MMKKILCKELFGHECFQMEIPVKTVSGRRRSLNRHWDSQFEEHMKKWEVL